ncbi:MAG: hypothetical protein ACYDHP_13880 [Ferrimicrobium sp.]
MEAGGSAILTRVIDTVLSDRVPSESLGSSRRVRAVARLMSLLGVVLFIGLAVEGITVVFIGQLIALHVLLAMILLPVMIYKIVIAFYRFSMYYLGARDFKNAGPPEMLLRVIGPLMILSTVVLMGSGIILIYQFPGTPIANFWRLVHQASFIVWFGVVTLHVLAYMRRAFGTAGDDIRHSRYHTLIGRRGRLISIAISLIVGGLLASLVMPAVGPWQHYFTVLHVR